MNIYMIGTLTFYKETNQMYKATEWRKQLDSWAYDNDYKTFNPAIDFEREINHTYNERLCVNQNDYYINKCDIAVANLDDIERSPGSIYELVRFRELRKPVIAFGSKSNSPHINSCISHHCETLDEVIEVLINMFSQQI